MTRWFLAARQHAATGLAIAVSIVAAVLWWPDSSPPTETEVATTVVTSTSASTDSDQVATVTTTTAPTTTTSTTTMVPYDGWWNPTASGTPYGDEVAGVLTFRGSPTRSYYGSGPVPRNPIERWRYPGSGALCSESSVGGESKVWCGTGWTGQPAVWERDGRTLLAFGAYDSAVHLLDAETGDDLAPPLQTGDIIKGSLTVDPDGYPLLYVGSRDNHLRVIAFDRPGELVELWRLSADDVSPTKWNNDWDGSPLILDDHLIEGGENSQFHIVKLNRSYGPEGLVQVAPQLVFNAPGWDDELVAAVGNNVSIESSVAVSGNTAYFANSGGLVQGWDLAPLTAGGLPTRTFRYWMGDDVDATVVIDDQGMLYVGAEFERGTQRSREVGQIVKLDPSRQDPLVWSVADQDVIPGGVWSTPALDRDVVYVSTDGGRLLGIDRETGAIRWTLRLPGPLWSSPVVVDDTLIVGDCAGFLHGFDVSDTSREPQGLWQVELGGCIESTPAVWDGGIYVGTRAGAVHAVADRE